VSQSKSKATASNLNDDWSQYKKLRNKSENWKKKLKLQSFNHFMNESTNKSKSAWSVLNKEIGKSKSDDIIKSITVNNEKHDNELDVANAFCKYFATPCSESTASTTSTDQIKAKHALNGNEPDYIPITIQEVQNAIKFLKVNKPVGNDRIPAKFYKLFSDEISPILLEIFNESLRKGHVPLVLKKTYIKCLYKGKGSRSSCTNYRPISIIWSTAKLLEYIIYKRLSLNLEETEQLSDSQHGYRKHRSTQSAVLQLTNILQKNGDAKQYTGMIFEDFQKAFDCLNHSLLLEKLEKLGVTDNNLIWFQSYFSDREICVRNGSATSSNQPLKEGTPQGSSLSGLLFSIYINEVSDLFENCEAIFYADDLVLLCSSDSIKHIQDTLQTNINKLTIWSSDNYMKINVKKTKTMLITPPRSTTDILNFEISGETIENVRSFRYLGVIIDDKLTWTEHLDHVCKSMNTRSYLINRHKSSISQKWLQLISTGIILTVLDYCLPAWGNFTKLKYSRLDSIIFRVIKMILPNCYNREKNKNKLF
jgi:hypothetical protein